MKILEKEGEWLLEKERTAVGLCRFAAQEAPVRGAAIQALCIRPEWRRKGYGSYLLKSLLARTGGYDRTAESLHTVPAPDPSGRAPADDLSWSMEQVPLGAGAPASSCTRRGMRCPGTRRG